MRIVVLQSNQMFVMGQSGLFKFGCTRAKVVVFGQKWLYSCKSGCNRARWLYSGKSGCICAKVVEVGKKWLYSG